MLLYALGSTIGAEILLIGGMIILLIGGMMAAQEVGLIVLYRWRLHPGMEASFVEAWSRISEILRSERGSLGSRLHRGSDGLWYSYAQWPSAEAREKAFAQPSVDVQASEQMRAAVAERFP